MKRHKWALNAMYNTPTNLFPPMQEQYFSVPHHMWMQKAQIQLQQVGFACPHHLSFPTTQAEFIEWRSTIHRSPPLPKILGNEAKSNH